ncbi:MAG: hypothetical protein HOH43_02850 [Candidatus Latescibacteria bacterium]|jgi:hypothetical protein|nr:hypothetical protein [Candidatus Latescibacterota bacterium]
MKRFTRFASILLTLVSIAHLLRILLDWRITVEHTSIPMWVSKLGVVLPGGLALLLRLESKERIPGE